MSAPTIKTKVSADTVEFDKSMKDVVKGIKDVSGELSGLGTTIKNKGSKSLTNFSKSVKSSINDLKPLAAQVKGIATSMAKWGAASVAAGAVAGAAIVHTSLSSIKELKNLAKMSDVSAASLQRGAFAAKSVGVDMEEYAQALKDVNDRLGDFNATGAGPMVDFFENIAPKVGITAAAFEGLSSEQSLALYVKSLEDANVSQQEMTFYMEAIAGDATKLIPLFANNAKQMKALKKEAKELGIGLSEIDVQQAMNAQNQLAKIGNIIKNELMAAVVELAPVITAIGKKMVTWFKGIKQEGGGLGQAMGQMAISIVDSIHGIAQAFSFVGRAVDVIKGIFLGAMAAIQQIVSNTSGVIADAILKPLSGIIKAVQFVKGAFNEGLGSGLIKIFQRFRLAMMDQVAKPIEYILELGAKLPDKFGGDMFQKGLGDIKKFRDEINGAASDLDDSTINSSGDEFDLYVQGMQDSLDTAKTNFSGFSDYMQQEAFVSAAAASASFSDAFGEGMDIEQIKAKIREAFTAVKNEDLPQPERDNGGEQTPALESVSLPEKGDQPEEQTIGTGIAAFQAETEKLLEAHLFRNASQEELLLQQYSNEMALLNEQLANKELTEEEHANRVTAIRKKQADVNKQLAIGEMKTIIGSLLQGSSKASKVMKGFAIYQAVMKGKQAAVDAWQAGMSTGGPWAPAVAAAYAGASIARTAGMINSIRSGGKSQGSSGGGGGIPSTPQTGSAGNNNGGGEQSASQPSRIFNVEFGGQSTTSTQQTRNLLELINEQAGDNVHINLRGA